MDSWEPSGTYSKAEDSITVVNLTREAKVTARLRAVEKGPRSTATPKREATGSRREDAGNAHDDLFGLIGLAYYDLIDFGL